MKIMSSKVALFVLVCSSFMHAMELTELIEYHNFDPHCPFSYKQDGADFVIRKNSLEQIGISKFVINDLENGYLLSLDMRERTLARYLKDIGIANPSEIAHELLLDAKNETDAKTCVAIKGDFSDISSCEIALTTQDSNSQHSLRLYKFDQDKLIKIKHINHQFSVRNFEWYNDHMLLLDVYNSDNTIILADIRTVSSQESPINFNNQLIIALPQKFSYSLNGKYFPADIKMHPFKRHTLLCFLEDNASSRIDIAECNLLTKRYRITQSAIKNNDPDDFNFYVKFLDKKENRHYAIQMGIGIFPKYLKHFAQNEIRLPYESMELTLSQLRKLPDSAEKKQKEKTFIEDYLNPEKKQ